MEQKILKTSTTPTQLAELRRYTITIDGYEYTAIQDRRYSFNTTSPSQVVQHDFNYSGHSIVQPSAIHYTILVSKYDRIELNKLLELKNTQKIFTLINPFYTVKSCIISSIAIEDKNVDVLTLSVSFQELNNSLSLAAVNPADKVGTQMFSDITLGSSSTAPQESSVFKIDEENTYQQSVLLRSDILEELPPYPLYGDEGCIQVVDGKLKTIGDLPYEDMNQFQKYASIKFGRFMYRSLILIQTALSEPFKVGKDTTMVLENGYEFPDAGYVALYTDNARTIIRYNGRNKHVLERCTYESGAKDITYNKGTYILLV